MKRRCAWASGSRLLLAYHDTEWGVPVHDDRKLFEFLILEGAQAGLSWETVLKKRENYRKAFENFDPVRISRYTDEDLSRLLADPGIIRNRLKVMATRVNAQCFLKTQEELGSFETYIWQFVGGTPIKNRFESLSDLPSKTRESEAMSGNLRGRGFKFVGPTICYAFMQAVGMVNDHTTDCFRYGEV
ncbi:MAG: DNA-3-methyladenine glycosylase I [Thermoplasmata archaeon]